MRPLPRLIIAWMLVGLYASGMFAMSSLSYAPLPSAWDLPHLDKASQAVEYGGLTFVLIRALCLCATRPSTSPIIWGAVLAVAYGVLDEFHRACTPGRTMSDDDLLADATGASPVAGVWLILQRRWPRLVQS
jgi:VanZ family protein